MNKGRGNGLQSPLFPADETGSVVDPAVKLTLQSCTYRPEMDEQSQSEHSANFQPEEYVALNGPKRHSAESSVGSSSISRQDQNQVDSDVFAAASSRKMRVPRPPAFKAISTN